MTWYNYPLFQTTLLGILLGIGFVVPPLWSLGLLGIAGLVYQLQRQVYSWRQLWWIWFIKSLLVAIWVWRVYPIDWIGFELGWIELPMIGFYWSTVSASMAVGGIGLYIAVQIYLRYLPAQFLIIIFPVLWLFAELVGSLAFAVFLYGPGGSIGTTFSMGYVGYLLGEHALLIQLTQIYGVYGLTMVCVAVAVLGLWLYQNKYKKVLYVAGGFLLLISNLPASEQLNDLDTVKIAVVDTVLPNTIEVSQIKAIHQEIITAASLHSPDYVLFPEDARVFDQSLASSSLRALLSFQYAGTDTIFIDSGRVGTTNGAVLQAAIFNANTNELYQSQKRYLVPQGEYMPYVYSWLLSIFGGAESSQALQERLAYRVGPDTSQTHFDSSIPAVLFCFEVVDPRGVARAIGEREADVPFVAHILSHAWIHHSEIFTHQLETMLQVQAIWNDTYIVSAANHAVGYTVTPQGSIEYPAVVATGEYWQLGIIEVPVR